MAFIDCIPAENARANIIFCCTPIIPVTAVRRCYEPLATRGYNIYAIDLRGSRENPLTPGSLLRRFDLLQERIRGENSLPVFLFGDTGMGGIFGQYYAATAEGLAGFAQFGCAMHRRVEPLGYPAPALAAMHPLLQAAAKVSPRSRIPFAVPDYKGYHADLDNGFYTELRSEYPGAFRVPIDMMATLIHILWDRGSALRQLPRMPTLVFKTTHDRYFPTGYFDDYFAGLPGPKKLVAVEDVHNSYYLYPDRFAAHVADWFDAVLNM